MRGGKMSFLYTLGSYIGYFLVLIVFFVFAVIFAKKKIAWPLYFVGGGIQLLAILGTQKKYALFGMGHLMAPYWIVYAILMLVALVLIRRRRDDYDEYSE